MQAGTAMADEAFISPTLGRLDFNGVMQEIITTLMESSEPVKLIVGTDSHMRDDVLFVTAIVVHRVGKGARYFYTKHRQRKITSLRQRIFYETARSLSLAAKLADALAEAGAPHPNVEIHCDVGHEGDTRELIRQVSGMITGSGFDAKMKPDSYGASKVADKHTK